MGASSIYIYIPLFKNLRMNFGTDFNGDFFPRRGVFEILGETLK